MRRSDIDALPEPSRSIFRAALDKADCDARKAADLRSESLPDVPMYDKGAVQMERDLQRLCELELSRRGIVYMHLSPRAREKAGWPDLTFCYRGVPFAIELKSRNGVLSEHQERLIADMGGEKNGWRTAVIRSYEEFRVTLDSVNNQGMEG